MFWKADIILQYVKMKRRLFELVSRIRNMRAYTRTGERIVCAVAKIFKKKLKITSES